MPSTSGSLYDNPTICNFSSTIEINAPALKIINESTISAGDAMVEVSLSSLLFGVLTVLSLTAIYFLIRQGSFAQTNAKILVLTTVVLYLSTGTYIAALIWNRIQAFHLVQGATNGLFTASYDGSHEIASFEDAVRQQSWMAAVALEVNCIISDGIVWWRACVIWRDRIVYCIGPLLVALTIVFGSIGYREPEIVPTTGFALLSTDNAFIKTAAVLSFATNALATALIAYKMWEHRQVVKQHFATAGIKSRVLNALALLIECGSIYCALVIFVMVYDMDPEPSRTTAGLIFTRVAEYFVYGCFTTLIAIYPTTIIVLVALKRSPIDTGGLSSLHQAYGRGAGGVGNGMDSTIVFHNSNIHGSAGEGTAEDAVEESWSSGSIDLRSPSMGDSKHEKGARSLV